MTDPNGDSVGRHRAERADGPGDRPPGPQPEAGDTWSDLGPPPAPPTTRRWWHRRRELLVLILPIAVGIAYAGLRDPTSTDPAPSLSVGPTITAAITVSPPSAAGTTASPTPAPSATRTPTPRPPATAAPTTTSITQSAAPPSAPVWTTQTIEATFVFRLGDSVSTNRTRLHLQGNGDLVIIDEVGTVRWRSDTAGTGNTAVFQDDGHFVVYDRDQRAVWTSGTAGRPGAVLVLAADGDVDIVHSGTVVWSSNTAH